jgi:hypothetical protein
MLHELWTEPEGVQSFFLSGPSSEAIRKLLHPDAKLVWTVEAESHFEAMTKYYEYMGWGKYTSAFPELDKQPYSEAGSP